MRRLELVSVTGEVIRLDQAPFYASPDVALSGLPRVMVGANALIGAGARVTSRRHATRDVPLRIAILADSPDEFDAAVSRLARAVDPVVGAVTVRFYREDGSAREIVATYVDGFNNVTLGWAGSRETQAGLIFEAHDPYWRAVEQVEIDVLASEFIGGGEPTLSNAPIASNAPIPSSGFNASGVQNFHLWTESDVETWPRWEVVGPASQLWAYNYTTGKIWSYELALSTGQRLVVDTAPTVRRVTLNDYNSFSGLSANSTLWPLVPGRNHIGVRAQNWSQGSSALLLSWRDRFLTC